MNRWDGLSKNRTSLNGVQHPDHQDYLAVVKAIQETQDFLLAFASNCQVMPDLETKLQVADSKIQALLDKLESYKLPKDTQDFLIAIQKQVEEVDVRRIVETIKRELIVLKQENTSNTLALLKLQDIFTTEVRGFQNRMLGTLSALETEMKTKLSDFEKKIEHTANLLDVQNLLKKLQ